MNATPQRAVRESDQHILARLHLKAVLPAIAPLARLDERARSLVRGESFDVRFSSRSGLSTTLSFRDGVVEVDRLASRPLELLFLSDRQVNKAFHRDGLAAPIPTGGLRHLAKLGLLSRLTNRLDHVLNASGPALRDQRLVDLQLEMMLVSLLPRAVAQLVANDEPSRQLLSPYPGAMVQFLVASDSSVWLQHDDGRIHWGGGSPSSTPDAVVTFRDRDVARAALHGELDNLAAVGAGDILVEGLIPFVDDLDRVMDRVAHFMNR